MKKRIRLMRSLGENLELVSNNSKFSIKPKRSFSRFTTYKRELIEKKKIKLRYNINNKTLNRLIATYTRKLSLDYFVMLLETRLDNVIYRSGVLKTRKQSRQFITHGLVRVNNNKVTSPCFTIKSNDLIIINISSSLTISNSYFYIVGGNIMVKSIMFYKNYKPSFNFFYLTKLLNR
ncbi:S4 domain-containing protein [Candidatus Vidania fulgoroideorum]